MVRSSPTATHESPYPGLACFDAAWKDYFHGRERTVDELLELVTSRIHRGGPIMVVAPSGAGKSSVLRAGLLPRLAEGRLPVVGSAQWPQIVMTPTATPWLALADHLGVGWDAGATLDDPQTQRRAVRAVLDERLGLDRPVNARLVLVVDQFEELFRECDDESVRAAFIDFLAGISAPDRDGHPSAMVIIGVRADSYGQCAGYEPLRAALRTNQLIVGPMSESELREAIMFPADRAGLELEPGLVEVLLRDLGVDSAHRYEPGRLPYLAFALQATWQQRRGAQLTVDGYQATGGIHHAIGRAADRVLAGLDDVDAEVARRLFLRLVKIDSGENDTRRTVRPEALASLGPRGEAVLTTFVDARLVSRDADAVTITHEALLRAWPRLKSWIDADRAGAVVRQELEDDAARWSQSSDASLLYRGTRLAITDDAAADGRALTEEARRFLAASRTARRRAALRLRALAALILALVLAVSTAAVLTVISTHRVDVLRGATLSELLANDSLSNGDPIVAPQLSIAAWSVSPTPQAIEAVDNSTTDDQSLLRGHTGTVFAVAFSPDGQELASASADHTARLWNAHTGALIAILRGHTDAVRKLAFSPDGDLLATASFDDTARVWNAHTGVLVATLKGHTGPLSAIAFSPDGKTIATASVDHTARLWDAHTGKLTQTLVGHGDTVFSVAFSPDGSEIATSSADHTARLWDVRTGAVLHVLTSTAALGSAVFSPDGKTVATAGEDKTVRLWDAVTGKPGKTLSGHTGTIYSVIFSPDGKLLATASADHTARLWDVASGVSTATLGGQTGAVNAVSFSPDGKRVATASADGTAKIWDTKTGARLAKTAIDGHVLAVAFSPDGSTIAVSGDDPFHIVSLWGSYTGLAPEVMTGPTDQINQLALSPNGEFIAAASLDNTVSLWNTSTGEPKTMKNLQRAAVRTVAFSPDSKTLVSGGDDPLALLWDVASGMPKVALVGFTGSIVDAAFSPDGATVATAGSDGTALIWNAHPPSGLIEESPMITLSGHAGLVTDVAYSPDGSIIATAGDDHTARLWNAHTGAPIATLSGHTDDVYEVAFSPDGSTLATASADQTARLWNAHTGAPIAILKGHSGPVVSVAFSPDGSTLATAGGDTTTQLWNARTGALIASLVGASDRVTSVAFSPDGSLVATTSGLTQTRLWNARTGQLVAILLGHTGSVYEALFSPDGSTLFTDGADMHVIKWRTSVYLDPLPELCTIYGPLPASAWRSYAPGEPYPASQCRGKA